MYLLTNIIQYLFPLIALVQLIIGLKRNSIQLIISALWLSFIALVIHLQFSEYQIFGTYFDYTNAAIYMLTLIVLVLSLIRILTHLSVNNPTLSYIIGIVNTFVVVTALIVSANLWINAFFIANKKPGTPVMQVALFDKPPYCAYKYIFYKITPENSVMFLCPNHFGLIASIGHLSTTPDFVTSRLHLLTKSNDTPKK